MYFVNLQLLQFNSRLHPKSLKSKLQQLNIHTSGQYIFNKVILVFQDVQINVKDNLDILAKVTQIRRKKDRVVYKNMNILEMKHT